MGAARSRPERSHIDDDSPMYEDLRFEVADHVGVLTLDRPDARNALRRQTYRELEDVVRGARRRRRALPRRHRRRPGVLLRRRRQADHGRTGAARREALATAPRLTPAADALLHTDVPVIAAVNGAAVGWGMELALMADIRVASERARFGELFVLRGLVSDAPGLGRLAQLVGRERAPSCCSPARSSTPRRRSTSAWCRASSPTTSCCRRPRRWPQRIAANPPLAVQALKHGLRRALDPDWNDARRVGARRTSPGCSRRPTTARAWPRSSRSARRATPGA